MITKQKDYDETPSFGQSSFRPLPKGGYICRMIMAEEMQDKKGNPMVHVAFDIVEGDYKGYFMDLFQSRKKANTDPLREIKYPFEGQAWIPVFDYQDPNKTSKKFKGFCTAIEDSGTEIWNLNGQLLLDQVKQAEVGVIFQSQEEEYNGKTRWKSIPWGFRSIESIASGDYFVPEDKPLEDTYGTAFENDSFSAQQDSIPF